MDGTIQTGEADRARDAVARWVEEAVVGLRLCPFAAQPWRAGQVRIAVSAAREPEDAVKDALDEAMSLVESDAEAVATTLVAFPAALADFETFLDAEETLSHILEQAGCAGILQVAGFHPDYAFADSAPDALGNWTNRAPVPILHLLREAQVSEAVDQHPDAEAIPADNVARLEALGAEALTRLWKRFSLRPEEIPMTTPDEVLAFWFGEPTDDQAVVLEKIKRWFGGAPAFDREVAERFGPAVHAALAGELDGWAATGRGALALVILLDQFTRNVFRGQPQTYQGDLKASALALQAFDSGADAGLGFAERMFLSMPLLHSEVAAHHVRLVELMESLSGNPPPGYAQMAAMNREQIAKYHDIVARFGRFPHRNAILGRTSTPEEEAFLVGFAERAPPRMT